MSISVVKWVFLIPSKFQNDDEGGQTVNIYIYLIVEFIERSRREDLFMVPFSQDVVMTIIVNAGRYVGVQATSPWPP